MALPRGYGGWKKQKKSTYWASKRKAKADLLNPQKPLAGGNLLGVAKASVGLALDPQVSALDQQARGTRIQQGAAASRAGNYYKNLAASVQGDVTRSQALTSTLGDKLKTIGAQGQAAVDTAQGVADVAQAHDVGTRGPGLSGGGDERVRAELAAQRANMAAGSQAAQETATNVGGSNEAFLRQMAAAGTLRGGEVQGQLLNRMQNELSDIRTKKAVLEGERGPMVVEQLGKLRQQAFENSATASALNQKKLATKYQAEADAADRALAVERIASSERQNNARIEAQIRGQDVSAGTQADAETGRNNRAANSETGLNRRAAAKLREQKKAKVEKERAKAQAKMPDNAQKALGSIGNIQAEYLRRWKGAGGEGKESLGNIANDMRKKVAGRPLLVNIGSAVATRGVLKRQGKYHGPLLTKRDISMLKAAYPGIQIPKDWH